MTTQKTPHRWADVLRAIADGEDVQFFSLVYPQEWTSPAHKDMNPIAFPDYEWRIAPKKKTVWVNVYPDGCISNGYASKEDAAAYATSRIACVPLTFTEGEGLE